MNILPNDSAISVGTLKGLATNPEKVETMSGPSISVEGEEEKGKSTSYHHEEISTTKLPPPSSPAPDAIPQPILPSPADFAVPTIPTPIETSTSQQDQAAAPTSSEESSTAIAQAQSSIEADFSPPISPSASTDAGYETDSVGSASTSLASSVRDFAFENGRRYHRFREGTYNFPNDDSEQDREDMKHAMVVMLCGRLHFAPIAGGIMREDEGMEGVKAESDGDGREVLDMGTGTGIWAIEMGDQYPGANILGIDLSPIQPVWVPPNVKFMVDDLESPWLRPHNYFDYIHGRNTVMGIRDWPKLMQNALDHLKPGGWLELQEVHHYPYCSDGTLPTHHSVREFWSNIILGLAQLGVAFEATLHLERFMKEAGFVNVSTRIFHIPIGMWPKNRVLKKIGLYWKTILMDGAQPIALGPITRGLKWSREEVEVWLVGVRKAYVECDRGVHAWMPLHIVCGQKGEETVES